MADPAPSKRHPLSWVPSAYLAEGIPFAMVIWVAGTLFKDLGHSDSDITVSLASIGLAWSLKPFWAAFLDMFRTKRFFVLQVCCRVFSSPQFRNVFHAPCALFKLF